MIFRLGPSRFTVLYWDSIQGIALPGWLRGAEVAPPREHTLRRQEDGERLARVEERSGNIAAMLAELKEQGAEHQRVMLATLKELREWKDKEHTEINERIDKVDSRLTYFSGGAAVTGIVFAALWDKFKAMF